MLKLEVGKVYSGRCMIVITRKDENFFYAKNIKFNCEIESEEFIFSDLNENRLQRAVEFSELKETTMEQIKDNYLALA